MSGNRGKGVSKNVWNKRRTYHDHLGRINSNQRQLRIYSSTYHTCWASVWCRIGYLKSEKSRKYLHGTVSSGKRAIPKTGAIMVEEETIYTCRHLGWYRIRQLCCSVWMMDPVLHFWFPCQSSQDVSLLSMPASQGLRVAIELIPPTNQHVKWYLRMIPKQVEPHWIIAAPIPWTFEFVVVDTSAKPVTLWAKKRKL